MTEHKNIHLPSPSYWPILLAFSFTLIAMGVIWSFYISIAGVILLLISIAGWTLENRAEEQEENDE